MKYQPGFTDFFMSPVTGRIILPMFPDLSQNYVWIGDRNDRPLPSPIIIDLRLEIVDIRRRLSETRFILQASSQDFDSSQALNELIPGILQHTDGIVSIAIPWVDYVPPILPEKNIWIGNADDQPEPYPRIFLQNLPSMLSIDPTKLLGAYNLYRGSPNPLFLGEPEIVKTLHITNMADLEEGYLWLGTDSSDPLNFGANRPVPIIVLPLANMADLPYQKIWRGTIGNRPEPSDALTDVEDDITTINENITNINTELGDINIDIESIFDSLLEITIELGDINIAIDSLIEIVSEITVDFGDIYIRLDALDDIVLDLQAQIDTNVASGLDHLADLQLQIDTAISSGLDAEAGINLRLDALDISVTTINTTITTIQSDITTIQTSITSILSDITSIFSSLATITSQITTILSDITAINTAISTILTDITSIYSSISTINTTITSLSALITDIQGDIINITTVLLPDIYTYIDTEITNITNNFIAGGVIDMDDNRIINLPCDPEGDDDAISFCFLWHALHDEVNVLWS